ncbi:MAG: 16S rRNA (guanine(966)-N(2))-methyltransferase RsmD [Dehalococcoidia bacterium]|nr:16S rRNA (guanine(966)-N(2))-methyltransferase RsmD [Dehalococcoidia bacterium]
MRVTGGKVKGTHLKTLPRRSIRPTTSVVRQAIFSVLDNSTANWDRVLDLYAGTGALGIEALSRRAEWVDFVDSRRSCCDIIRNNLRKIGELHRTHVYCCTVSKALGFLENSYDIIFADPPYSDPSAGSLLMSLAESRLVGRNSTVVLCHANRFPLSSDYDGLHLIKQRRYGDTFISIFQKEV